MLLSRPEIDEGLLEFRGYGTRFAVTDGPVIDPDNRYDFRRRPQDHQFTRPFQRPFKDRRFSDRYAQGNAQVQHNAPGDSGKDVMVGRVCDERTVEYGTETGV